MFTFAFIINIVVLGIGGVLLLVGLLLLGFGLYALLKARRATESTPSYSQSVDYPAENGIEKGFEDKQQWADEIVAGASSTSDIRVNAASEDAPQSEASSAASNWFKNVKHAREKSFLVVGALLGLIGIYMLLSTIALIS